MSLRQQLKQSEFGYDWETGLQLAMAGIVELAMIHAKQRIVARKKEGSRIAKAKLAKKRKARKRK